MVPVALVAAVVIAYVPGHKLPIMAAILLMTWHIAVLRMSGRGWLQVAFRAACMPARQRLTRQIGTLPPGTLMADNAPCAMMAGR
ncbi:hypothetical protein A8B82_08115 [Sulfitobacter sp. EhC04]|nr:hypothetical protein A8B82_08115 [Sulfitobacter sp. EhC04]